MTTHSREGEISRIPAFSDTHAHQSPHGKKKKKTTLRYTHNGVYWFLVVLVLLPASVHDDGCICVILL